MKIKSFTARTLARVSITAMMALASSTALAQAPLGCNVFKPFIRTLEIENRSSGSTGTFKQLWGQFNTLQLTSAQFQVILTYLFTETEKVAVLTNNAIPEDETNARQYDLMAMGARSSSERVQAEFMRDGYRQSATKLRSDLAYLFDLTKWARDEGIRVAPCPVINKR